MYCITWKNRPLELLRCGMMKDIKDVILNKSKKRTVNNLKFFEDLTKDVKVELVGFVCDPLNDYLGGLRPSELTVLTGGNSYGKTTFICEYAIDFLHRVDKNINDIFNILKENIIQCDIQYLVIDNLQFIIGISTLNTRRLSSMDKFNLQDRCIGLLHQLPTNCGIHVTLVVHPNISESGEITQKADNVIALTRKTHPTDPAIVRKFLVILKNRFGGKMTSHEQLEMIYQAPTYTHLLIDHSRINQENHKL
uniref:Twinkle protein, mitochondrial (inferred by orthology to a human protein) n=1 Tax=Strongyloides venezuelensis TaxID=75913 RepID=A0A0K0EYE2_STRVS